MGKREKNIKGIVELLISTCDTLAPEYNRVMLKFLKSLVQENHLYYGDEPEVIIPYLSDKDDEVRHSAIELLAALAENSVHDKRTIKHLVKGLNDPNDEICEASARTLLHLAEHAIFYKYEVKHLENALKRENKWVQSWAGFALFLLYQQGVGNGKLAATTLGKLRDEGFLDLTQQHNKSFSMPCGKSNPVSASYADLKQRGTDPTKRGEKTNG